MQRVTSRPRLFSWDQFDASAPSSDSSSEEEEEEDETQSSEYETCVSMSRHASLALLFNSFSDQDIMDDGGEEKQKDEILLDSSLYEQVGLSLTNDCVVVDGERLDPSSSSLMDSLDQTLLQTSQQVPTLRKRNADGMKKSPSGTNLRGTIVPSVPLLLVEPPPLQKESCHEDFTKKKKKEEEEPLEPLVSSTTPCNQDYESSSCIIHQPLDVQLEILSFLDLVSLRSVLRTCSQLHELITGPTTTISQSSSEYEHEDYEMILKSILWCPLMTHLWPPTSQFVSNPSTSFVVQQQAQSQDDSRRPRSTSTLPTPYATVLRHASRIPLMTYMNSHDDTLFSTYKLQHPQTNQNDNDTTTTREEQSWVSVVQYIGSTGLGDRSLVSNHPFPLPITNLPPDLEEKSPLDIYSSTTASLQDPSSNPTTTNTTLFQRFKHASRAKCTGRSSSVDAIAVYESFHKSLTSKFKSAHSSQHSSTHCHPFVAPYFTRYQEIDLTPRQMAYFEISILHRQESHEPRPELPRSISERMRLERRVAADDQTNRSTECVAVGLSLPGYASYGRMPGWDSLSYGYHGDDGGLFHAKGDMLRKFGPTYGKGDTVGCGVQYDTGAIFFTKNGEWLGYAWTKEPVVLQGRTELYPTVGVDSQCPIACNFGTTRPFVFDFAAFVGKQGSLPLKD